MKLLQQVKCDGCGSDMIFSPSKQKLFCEHCGNTKEIQEDKAELRNIYLDSSGNLVIEETEETIDTEDIVQCSNCGASFTLKTGQATQECPFCATRNVIPARFEEKKIKPQGVIPFTISREEANNIVSNWLGKGLFTPSDLKQKAKVENIRGIYVPMWAFNLYLKGEYSVDIGYYYYETETYTDENGNTQTRQVQRTRWEPYYGTMSKRYNDIPITALKEGILEKFFTNIADYNITEAKNFNPNYLLGFEAAVYNKPINEGVSQAKNIAENQLRNAIESSLPGDTYRNLRLNTEILETSFKHLIAPVWIISYHYNGKVRQILVNGQTGNIEGEKPVSTIKVIIAIVIAIIIIGLIVYFFNQQ